MQRWITLSTFTVVLAARGLAFEPPRLIQPSDILAVAAVEATVKISLKPFAAYKIIPPGNVSGIQFGFQIRACKGHYRVSDARANTITITCPNDACAIELAASIKAIILNQRVKA